MTKRKGPTPRSQGSLQLARKNLPQDIVATALGVSCPSVSYWVNGTTKPKADKRAKLCELYGIQPAAWDEPIKSEAAPPASPTDLPAPAPATPTRPWTPAERCDRIERMINRALDRANDPSLSERARMHIAKESAAAMNLLAKLRGESDLGPRFFRSNFWEHVKDALRRGLRGHPSAAAAVAHELGKLEDAWDQGAPPPTEPVDSDA